MESKKNTRQQRTVGAIVKIPLENGFHTYARILPVKLAFYDSRTKEELPIDEIVLKPVLFVLSVYDIVITKGFWLKVGKKLPLEPHLLELEQAPVYSENVLQNSFIIHYANKQIVAKKEEIMGLESWTIWTNSSVEKRLNDYYSGNFNENEFNSLNGKQITGMIEKALKRKAELLAINKNSKT